MPPDPPALHLVAASPPPTTAELRAAIDVCNTLDAIGQQTRRSAHLCRSEHPPGVRVNAASTGGQADGLVIEPAEVLDVLERLADVGDLLIDFAAGAPRHQTAHELRAGADTLDALALPGLELGVAAVRAFAARIEEADDGGR